MTLIGMFGKWLAAPPVTGTRAFAGAIALVAVPTLLRLAVDGEVTGIGFLTYSPSVLLAALLLGPALGALVAVAGAAMADSLFVGPRYQLLEGPTDLLGGAVFLVSAALAIVLVQACRSQMRDRRAWRDAGQASSGLVFSLDHGQAWASWYEGGPPVRLGPQEEVAEMMQDFLAQLELGKRLTRDRA